VTSALNSELMRKLVKELLDKKVGMSPTLVSGDVFAHVT
jgi:hypothetical protein